MNDQTNQLTVIKPEMEVASFDTQKKTILELVKAQMKADKDYGIIPGTKTKSLFQPGAEKLAKLFGLSPRYTLTKEVEKIDEPPYFAYYRYKCELIHLATGSKVGEAERSCNSSEGKYRNKSVHELMNTCQAMAQKRALVAAVRTATMASDIFIDDIEDNGQEGTGPAKKTEDPARVNLITKLHIAGDERGFHEKKLHEVIKNIFNADSITELTNVQISAMTEKMVANYQIVPKGSAPKKFEIKNTESVNLEEVSVEEVEAEPVEEVKTSPANCRKCNKVVPEGNVDSKGNPLKWFCDDKCKDEFWAEAEKANKEKHI